MRKLYMSEEQVKSIAKKKCIWTEFKVALSLKCTVFLVTEKSNENKQKFLWVTLE